MKVILVIFALLFVSCVNENRIDQQTISTLKTAEIQYVPAYFYLDFQVRRNVQYIEKPLSRKEFVDRISKFSYRLMESNNTVIGYFLVDSLGVLYDNLDDVYLTPDYMKDCK